MAKKQTKLGFELQLLNLDLHYPNDHNILVGLHCMAIGVHKAGWFERQVRLGVDSS